MHETRLPRIITSLIWMHVHERIVPMPEDVERALTRLYAFLEKFGEDAVIDADSGFTAADAQLLIGELEMAQLARRIEAQHPHDDD
jgi:hypothetical protein